MAIKFNMHNVTDGTHKARVFYSAYVLQSGGVNVVVLYARDYNGGDALRAMFADLYKNETDLQSDYFDKGSVRIPEGHALYAAALAARDNVDSKGAARRAKRLAPPQAADPSTVTIVSEATSQYGTRIFDLRSGSLSLTVSIAKHGVTVRVQNAAHRAWRGAGKTFRTLDAAKRNYRDAKVLAALAVVERACWSSAKPRVHVKADCTEVVS